MKKFICLALLLVAGILAGQAQTKAPKSKKKKPTTSSDSSASASSARLIGPKLSLHFISKGAGIDNATYEKIEAFANNHPKKPSFTVEQQGREGEKVMRFTLVELTPDEQVAFAEEVKAIIGANDLVKITSKVPSKKKGVITPKSDIVIQAPPVTRLVISFISKGAGVANDDFIKIRSFIQDHPKGPDYEVKHWGREGEKDFLLQLGNFNADEQKVFIDDVKKLISKPDLILIRENEAYVKKGR